MNKATRTNLMIAAAIVGLFMICRASKKPEPMCGACKA